MLFSNAGSQFSFECKCERGFHGQLCELSHPKFSRLEMKKAERLNRKINTSVLKSNLNPCLNGGVLTDSFSRTCKCTGEFSGKTCEIKECPAPYNLIEEHTMCLKNSYQLISGNVSSGEKEFILITHNSLRKKVKPAAANMQKVYWDSKLQELAQKRAQLCDIKKIDITMRQQPGYGMVIGENIAAGYESWPQVLALWMSESKSISDKNIKAGHYTQVI